MKRYYPPTALISQAQEQLKIFVDDIYITMNEHTKTGIGVGAVLAMIISWSANKSVLWALLHGAMGWGYVLYSVVMN